ncbi:alpha-amylase family glycosyl hydrolase [Brevundimonas sp.]|uniref:alpha-amylase family glycosyl hydrolase n=1 Tax=Brevundimonas sp. TaxID=1871086 RepID=UPI00289FF212|nr:alpha-amylase family glycosyl hydrolase [Brevundimonas sp.]
MTPPQAHHEWWRGAVIYQIYPRSFADTSGDGIGDLKGITAHLDHVASLGVDAVWISPFYPSPMKDFGYDVADYCGVDPVFGTLADFDALLAKAHGLGLRVIVDQVWSHTSDQHPWFQASRQDRTGPHADWYVWADARADGSPPNNWQSVFGGPGWTWDARRGQYYQHNFLPEQPQLNGRHPAVQDALLAAAEFWLDRGVDGFRLDAVNFMIGDPGLRDNPPLPPGGRRTRPFDFQDKVHNQSSPDILPFLERVRALTERYDGDRFTVAEIPGDHAAREMKAFTAEGRLNSAYGFLYLYADRLTADLVRTGAEMWPGEAGEGWPSWAFSNHDAPRVVSRWAEGRDERALAELLMLLLVCLRGDVFVYYGEELGLPQGEVPYDRLVDPEAIANWPQTLGRDGARTPMPWRAGGPFAGFSTVEPWLPIDARHPALAVDAQKVDPNSMLKATRRILGLRRACPALRIGDMTVLTTHPLLTITREGDGETLLAAFNLGHEAQDWTAPEGYVVVDSVNVTQAGILPPLGGVLLRRTGA